MLRTTISKDRKRICLPVLNSFHGIFLVSTLSLIYTKEGFIDAQNRKLQDLHPINALKVYTFIVFDPGVTCLVRKAECLAFLIYMAFLSDGNIYIPYIMQMSFLLTSHYFSESSPPKVTIFVSNVVQADNVMRLTLWPVSHHCQE